MFAFEKEKEERKEPKFGIDGKKAKEVVEGGTGKDEFIGEDEFTGEEECIGEGRSPQRSFVCLGVFGASFTLMDSFPSKFLGEILFKVFEMFEVLFCVKVECLGVEGECE